MATPTPPQDIDPSNFKTMRDINDYCERVGVPSLAQGMIELPPPQRLRQIASEVALTDNVHTYRTRYGEKEFREAISQLLEREYSTKAAPEAILATQGVSGGIVASFAWLNSKGKSRIGLVEPFYTYHIFQIKRIWGEDKSPVYVKAKADFSPDWEAIEKALDAGLDGLLVCNPSNPTGRVWSKEELDRLVALTSSKGCLLILDECYADMVWDGVSFYSPIQTQLHDNLIVVRGFSKVLGAQSWRVGYVVSSPKMVEELMRVADPIYICVSWLQHAIAQYLNEGSDFVEHKKRVGALIRRNWSAISAAMKNKLGWEPIEPSGTMYGMFKHNEPSDMEAVIKALQKGVGICPGSMFFAEYPSLSGFVRIHCGVSETKADDIVSRLSA